MKMEKSQVLFVDIALRLTRAFDNKLISYFLYPEMSAAKNK